MKSRRRKTALSFGVVVIFAVVVSCREPTEITVVIKTGETCGDLSGVEIVVGPDQAQTQARFEQQYNAAVTRECGADGTIGTLVITPGGHGGTIVVAAGVRSAGAPAPDPSTCSNAETAKSCIVARRSFSFLSHTSLTLPIELDPLCLGKACDPASTCFKGGCVPAAVICANNECGLPQENPGQGTGSGSGNDAGSSDGAYDAELDGMSFDDVAMMDGASDGTIVTDGGPDADSGDSNASVPFCVIGGGGASWSAFCSATANGTQTAGACTDPSNKSANCCRCTCKTSGSVTDCNMSATASVTACPVVCP